MGYKELTSQLEKGINEYEENAKLAAETMKGEKFRKENTLYKTTDKGKKMEK